MGFRFGIAGPYAYAAGATVQILLFAILASNLKMKAPNAHTFLEIIGERWGTGAHLVFLFFGFLANVIVSTMLVLGGVSHMLFCLSGYVAESWCTMSHRRLRSTISQACLPKQRSSSSPSSSPSTS